VLGLGQQIERDGPRIRRRRSQHKALGRACRKIDRDLAADLELRRDDPGVAGSDDAINGLEILVREPERQGPDGLGAAGDDQRLDVEQPGDAEEHRVDDALAIGW
jgi:hypothetical protein